ncbi:MAG: TIGR03936 family radical SAM-associated protein [Oscillospiraceae bacterium]|jgi:radical SAM-linked protein|nr:TIGR03936 family radical SAM-associated protein [Oscillospiraceae bacterium]
MSAARPGRLRLLFEKTGRARYISHLDLMQTLRRVFARADVALRRTEGFNPHPYISLALPLPVGQESVCELMDFETEAAIHPEIIPELLNPKMPEGIRALRAYAPARALSGIKWVEIRVSLEYDAPPRDAGAALAEYFSADSIVVPKRTKRGIRDVDIAPAIRSVRFSGAEAGRVEGGAVISASEPALNPELLLTAIARDAPSLSPDYALIRRVEIFDADMNVFR